MMDKATAKALFGRDLASDYACATRLMNTTPSSARVFDMRRENGRVALVLLLKSVMLSAPAKSGIFKVSADGFKGYQQGNPSAAKYVLVDLYSNDGNVEFALGADLKHQDLKLTQGDVNRVLQTLHRANAEVPTQRVP